MAPRLNSAPMPGIENSLGCTCCHSANELRSLKKATKLRERAYLRKWEDDYETPKTLPQHAAGECSAGFTGCYCARDAESSDNIEDYVERHGYSLCADAPAPRDHRLGRTLRPEDLPEHVRRAFPIPRNAMESLELRLGLDEHTSGLTTPDE